MEFNPRDFQPRATNSSFGDDINTSQKMQKKSLGDKPPRKKLVHRIKENRITAILSLALLGATVVLVLALIFGISFAKNESSIVDKKLYQVVALADDQAYFGVITSMNSRYLVLEDVFYLNEQDTPDSTTTATQLIKRGCEIHSPTDTMVVTRERINFWENLKSDGQVAKLIAQWHQQNPDGQKCNTTNPTQQTTTESTLNNSTNSDTTTDANDTSTDTTAQ